MENGGADCEEIDAKLVHETLQLLSNVTYIRVVIDRINWQITPKFVVEEAKHTKSPRNRGQIFLTYQIPALQKASPRGSNKIFKVVAKSISEEGIIFNEKHVSLCKITSAIIDNWATNQCEIKCYYCPSRKRSPILFARCAIPMSKILVLPFSFDSSKVQLEMISDASSSRGYLKMCMQLGSRMQHFLERVEPMRNPTTSVSPLTFLDPTTVRSPRKPNERHYRLLSAETLPGQYVVERHDREQYSGSAAYTRPRFSPTLQKPAADRATDLSPVSSHRRPAYLDDDQFSTRFSRRRLLNGRNGDAEHDRNSENDRIGGRNFEFDTRPNHEKIEFFDKNNHLHRSQPASPTLQHHSDTQSSEFLRAKRKPTVAERLKLSVGESLHTRANEFNHEDERRQTFPPVSNGYWLQVTIHQAKHLPFIKSKKTGRMRKPNCFVTYRNNERILTSNVVANSLNPNWRWTTQLFVPSDRKNVVFKIWHKPATDLVGNKSKVIGFVAFELPTVGPCSSATSWYDIMDLARSSSGQLQISVGPPDGPLPPDLNEQSQNQFILENGAMYEEDLEESNNGKSSSNSSSPVKNRQELLLIDLDEDENNVDQAKTLNFQRRGNRPLGTTVYKSLSIPNLSPFSSQTTDRKLADKNLNTSFVVATGSNEMYNRRETFDPFVDLTSRSFLSDKLKNNIDELTELLDRLRRRSTSAQSKNL